MDTRKNESQSVLCGLDINEILNLIPHRYPILLVDRVLELEPYKCIKALKNVSVNEPYFVGHFPKRPVMPGVLMIEALAQTAALLIFADSLAKNQSMQSMRPSFWPEISADPSKTPQYFAGIDQARFRRPVVPGDQLILDVKFERYLRGLWKFRGLVTVDGSVAVEATLMCTVRPVDLRLTT